MVKSTGISVPDFVENKGGHTRHKTNVVVALETRDTLFLLLLLLLLLLSVVFTLNRSF